MLSLSRRRHSVVPFILVVSWCALVATPSRAGHPASENPPPVAATEPAGDPTLFAKAEGAQLNPAPAAGGGATGNVVINLINRLVDRGLLPKEDAVDLIRQAEADAERTRERQEITEGAVAQTAAMAQAAAQIATQAAAPPPTEDSMRVTYIPEIVKAQLRDQIKSEMIAAIRNGDEITPNRPMAPEWTSRIRISGDVRLRADKTAFPDGNDNTGSFPNFNAINTGVPFDTSGTVFSPQLNVDQNRQRLRVRARLAFDVDMREGFSGGIRIATGDTPTPLSTNQTLGAANQGQGGNFSKTALWLDRGFLKYELGGQPGRNLAMMVGRFENPFFTPSEMVWDIDVNFDGVGMSSKYQLSNWFTPFIVGGAFPVFNTDLNFATNQPAKFKSTDKWLYGGQAGFEIKPKKNFVAKLAGAYYHFDGAEGRLSDPFTPLNPQDQGNTDDTRPSFAQKGNTYMALRDIVPSALNDFGTTNQYQYFGLATAFRELVLSGKLDYNGFETVQISAFGEFAKNLAFKQGEIDAKAVNNRGPLGVDNAPAKFDGGDMAWLGGVRVGHAVFQKRGDWNLAAIYRHVESDALMDAFTDSNFGLGGTNMKGYTFTGSVALSAAVNLQARFMSANEIAGPPMKSDTFFLELFGRF